MKRAIDVGGNEGRDWDESTEATRRAMKAAWPWLVWLPFAYIGIALAEIFG